MPNYDHRCPSGHTFEIRRSIRERDATPTLPCPECGEDSPQVFLTMPNVNDTEVMILDYPGSRRLKAGYVHAYCDPGVKKVSSGYGGALNPSMKERDPIAKMVKPEWKVGMTKGRER